nr:D195 [uncultured bacterium]
MIERPSAEVSRGTCKICGEIRDFQNEPTRALYLSQKRRAALAAGE